MGTTVEEQYANVTPPRRGECMALAVDVTARPYDLTVLPIQGVLPEAAHSRRLESYLTMRAITADVWFYFSGVTASDLSAVANIAVGGALSYPTTNGWVIPVGTEVRVRIDRSRDLFLICQTAAGTATLLVRASSNPGIA